MSLCAYHRTYLAAPTQEAIIELVRKEWNVDLKLGNNPRTWNPVSISVGCFIQVHPCPYGYLAVAEDQERLTGDIEDQAYAERVAAESWDRMLKALAVLKGA